jgi:uncharacterized protein
VISHARTFLVTFLILLSTLFLQAEPISQLRPKDYVNDFAHVLDPTTIAQIDGICRQIDEKAHAQIAVVTINSLDGSDIETYSVDLFKKWGIGSKATDRGVLILYAIRDRRARIEVGYGLEPILPDGKVGSFQREAVPLLQRGDYSGALLLVTTRVAEVIAKDGGIQLPNSQPRVSPEPPDEPSGGLSTGAIVGIVVVLLLVLFTPLRSLLFWMLVSGSWGGGRSRGYSGGGGWGGGAFGGRGGFGGFGGGSSGGGGASSSW